MSSTASTNSMDQLCALLDDVGRRYKLDAALLNDLYWSSTSDSGGGGGGSDVRLPHTERIDPWLDQRRQMKLNQIKLARASDQQAQAEQLSRETQNDNDATLAGA